MQIASRFAYRCPVLRSNHPLSDDQIRTVAPSIFADTPHESRSERYSYIPTAAVLTELRTRVRQLRPQVLVFARAHFQKCHYNSASCSGAAGFSIPNA